MSESRNQALIRLGATDYGYTLFRNNVGKAWQGDVSKVPGGIFIANPRRVDFGLTRGSSDLIGFKLVVITDNMVGQAIPVFAGIEVKSDKGRPRKHQVLWHNFLTKCGAISAIARSPEDLP